jgi:hypothetical protein
VSKREDYLCFFCPAYRSSPVHSYMQSCVSTIMPAVLYNHRFLADVDVSIPQGITLLRQRSNSMHLLPRSDCPLQINPTAAEFINSCERLLAALPFQRRDREKKKKKKKLKTNSRKMLVAPLGRYT